MMIVKTMGRLQNRSLLSLAFTHISKSSRSRSFTHTIALTSASQIPAATSKMIPDAVFSEDSSNSNNNITQQLVHHLERTSLVDFESAEALSKLNEAINFANQLFEVNTDGVEPLVTVLENESLYLRDDHPQPTNRQAVLKNASVTEEDYFVAPPGNIPLEPASKPFLQDDKK